MANELKLSCSLEFTKNGITDSLSVSDSQFDVSGTKFIHNVQAVAATEEAALDISGLTTPGYMLIKNLDDTNYVEVTGATGEGMCVKLKAGEVALFRHAGAAPFVQANTSTVTVEYLLIED